MLPLLPIHVDDDDLNAECDCAVQNGLGGDGDGVAGTYADGDAADVVVVAAAGTA